MMRIVPLKTFFLVALIAIIALSLINHPAGKNRKKASNLTKGFAVVELFTSEGCSSCPPADELVAKIQKENKDQPVYILAFHVDYWNRLGWKDPFSSAAFSNRQSQYAHWLNAQVYTPQVVVNGSKVFVGSDEGTMRNVIKVSLQQTAEVQLSVKEVKRDKDKVNFQFQAEGNRGNTSLLVALIQKTALSKVLKGENGGRTLSHVQVVRNLESINLNGHQTGSVSIKIPDELNKINIEIIVFIQNNDNGKIISATKSELDCKI